MIQFTYKLKLNERVGAKCSCHFHYNRRNTDGLREHYFRIARKLQILRYTWNAR
jgi:hypothetical protein